MQSTNGTPGTEQRTDISANPESRLSHFPLSLARPTTMPSLNLITNVKVSSLRSFILFIYLNPPIDP